MLMSKYSRGVIENKKTNEELKPEGVVFSHVAYDVFWNIFIVAEQFLNIHSPINYSMIT